MPRTEGRIGVTVDEILPASEFRRRMKIGAQTLRCWKESGLKIHDDLKTEGVIVVADFLTFLRKQKTLVPTYDERRRQSRKK